MKQGGTWPLWFATFAAVALLIGSGIVARQPGRVLNEAPGIRESASQRIEIYQHELPSVPAPPMNPAPDRSEYREEMDLIAQQRMSYWTVIIALVSVFATTFTAFGVWLVARTLAATRDSVELMRQTLYQTEQATLLAKETVAETKRIGDGQLRSYIAVVGVEPKFSSTVVVEVAHFTLKMSAISSGPTPARSAKFSIHAVEKRADGGTTEILSLAEELADFRPNIETKFVDVGVELGSDIYDRVISEDSTVQIFGSIHYDALFNQANPLRAETWWSYIMVFDRYKREWTAKRTAEGNRAS